jgi:hypothetical protein
VCIDESDLAAALRDAVEMGDAEMVRTLLEGGAVAEGRSLVQSAVAAGNTEVRSSGSLASSIRWAMQHWSVSY